MVMVTSETGTNPAGNGDDPDLDNLPPLRVGLLVAVGGRIRDRGGQGPWHSTGDNETSPGGNVRYLCDGHTFQGRG